MLLAGLIGIGTYAGPVLAAAVLLPVRIECGTKYAWGTWLATALLCFMIVPDRELALFWVFFGWYPIILPKLEKIKPAVLKILVELCIYAALILLMYGVFMKLLGIDPELSETRIINIVLAVAGGACFLLFDRFYKVVEMFYRKRLKR